MAVPVDIGRNHSANPCILGVQDACATNHPTDKVFILFIYFGTATGSTGK